MTTKAALLLEDYVRSERNRECDMPNDTGPMNRLVAYIDELERKAQAWDTYHKAHEAFVRVAANLVACRWR